MALQSLNPSSSTFWKIIIDQKLNWTSHVNRAGQMLGSLWWMVYFLTPQGLSIIYKAEIRGEMEYYSLVHVPAASTALKTTWYHPGQISPHSIDIYIIHCWCRVAAMCTINNMYSSYSTKFIWQHFAKLWAGTYEPAGFPPGCAPSWLEKYHRFFIVAESKFWKILPYNCESTLTKRTAAVQEGRSSSTQDLWGRAINANLANQDPHSVNWMNLFLFHTLLSHWSFGRWFNTFKYTPRLLIVQGEQREWQWFFLSSGLF